MRVYKKIPKYIQAKMHRIASLTNEIMSLDQELDDWFVGNGYDIEVLRKNLDELEYGNDITDKFCKQFEAGRFDKYRKIN